SLDISPATKKAPPAIAAAPPDQVTVSSAALVTTPANSSAGHVFVQLGAFGSKDNASRLQKKLLLHFPAAHTVAMNIAEKTLYKVRIGPFEDMMNIEKTVIALEQQGFQKPMVIIE
ncbi:MAG: SPOR domain-containing protein, partial [Mariprofundus sp.]